MPSLHADCALFKAVLHHSLDKVLWDLFFSCNHCPAWPMCSWFGVDFLAMVIKIQNTITNREC